MEDTMKTGKDVSYCIDSNYHKGTNTTEKSRRQLVMESDINIIQLNDPIHSNNRVYDAEGLAPTLNTMGGGNRQPFVAESQEDRILKLASVPNKERKHHVKAKTIPNTEVNVDSDKCIATRHLGRNGSLISDVSSTVQVAETPHVTVAYSKSTRENHLDHRGKVNGEANTLSTGDGCVNQSTGNYVANSNIRIRKLTPLECERLMGWPDNWTKYGKLPNGTIYEVSNTSRYKAIGNGVVAFVTQTILHSLIPEHETIRVFSTFAGVDGSCMLLDKNRFIKVAFSEYDPYSKQQHAANILNYKYPNVPNLGDITKVVPNQVPDHDLMLITAPCQSFSIAGTQRGLEDTRGTLFYETAKILEVKKPKYILFENVKNLLSHDGGKTFEIMIEVYSQLGYELDFEVLNAKYFGVAQNRERVFMFGKLRDIKTENNNGNA